MRGAASGLAIAAALAACGGSGASGGDAGPPDAGNITAPTPPAAPVLTPCPMGWREVAPTDAEDVATCDPWPATGEATCADDEAHFPGEPGCVRVGSACPAGDFPDGLPAGTTIVYVRAGASGGNGTQGAPFGLIADAVAGAAPGTIVALAKGTYDEIVTLPAGVTLWGACVAMTRVGSSTTSESAGSITTTGAGAVVKNLGIGGERPGVWLAGPASAMHLEDVVIANVKTVGIYLPAGTQLTAHTLVVRGTRSRSDHLGGRGIDAQGGRLDLGRAVIAANRDMGIHATAGAMVALADVVLRDTLGRDLDGTLGRGLSADSGATIDPAVRVVVERNLEFGVYAGSSATMGFTDLVVRDTQRGAAGLFGDGLSATGAATVVVSRASFDRNQRGGVSASGAGATLTLSDVAVRDSEERGVSAQKGASLHLDRAVVARSRTYGVYVSGTAVAAPMGVTVTLADVVVRDTRATAALPHVDGRGLVAQSSAGVTIDRAIFVRNRGTGVYVSDSGSSLALTDVVIEDTLSQDDQRFGQGLSVVTGASATVARAVVRRNRDSGISVSHPGTTLTAEQVTISDTDSRELDGEFGRGISVQEGATVVVRHALIAHDRDVGVYAGGMGTVVDLTDVVVSDTSDQACAATATCGWQMTTGFGAYAAAALSATGFTISTSALCGVQLATGGTMDLTDGTITRNPIGANVQSDGFDLARITTGVVYLDNDVNFDGSMLPIPGPATP